QVLHALRARPERLAPQEPRHSRFAPPSASPAHRSEPQLQGKFPHTIPPKPPSLDRIVSPHTSAEQNMIPIAREFITSTSIFQCESSPHLAMHRRRDGADFVHQLRELIGIER